MLTRHLSQRLSHLGRENLVKRAHCVGIRLCSSEPDKPNESRVSIKEINFGIKEMKKKPAKYMTWEEKRAISLKAMATIADEQKEDIIAELQGQLNNENTLESEKKFVQWQIDNFDKLKTAEVGFFIGRRYKFLDRYYEPIERTKKVLRDDVIDTYIEFKGKFQRFTDQLREIERPLYMYRNERRKIFSEFIDVLVIGGGMMGMSFALNMSDSTKGLRIVVVEKDLSYDHSSSAHYHGEVSYNFEDDQDFRMHKMSTELMQRSVDVFSDDDHPPYKVDFNPVGHLTLACPDRINELLDSFHFQRYNGIHVKMLDPNALQRRFPWINTQGIAGGLYVLQRAGWYEPFDYLRGIARKAKLSGVEIVQGEVIGSTIQTKGPWTAAFESKDIAPKRLVDIQIRLPDGTTREICAHLNVLACGHQSDKVGELLGMGSGDGPFKVGVPTRKSTQRLYCFFAPKGPALLLPFFRDTSGLFVRREGLADQYVCGRSYPVGHEPDLTLTPEEYFYQQIHPILANRIPGFRKVRLLRSWIRTYNSNPYDGKGLLGLHPVVDRTQVCCGFSHAGPHVSFTATKHLVDVIIGATNPIMKFTGYNYDRMFPELRIIS